MIANLAEKLIDLAVVRPVRRSTMLQKLVRHVANAVPVLPHSNYAGRTRYVQMKELFIRNGDGSPFGRGVRSQLVERFEWIHRNIRTASTATDALVMAEALLSLECEGDVVECGCFNGGSTAKLSVLAKLVGRKLHVFDSFEGLPEPNEGQAQELNARLGEEVEWAQGQYAAPLERVQANVERYGDVSVCTFHKGWFSETLNASRLPGRIALAFTDVDLVSSARDCLVGIWPRLSVGGIYFSHDMAFVGVLQVFADKHLWRDLFREPVPIFFGAGFGLCDASPKLGYMVKGSDLSADYLKRLMRQE